MKSFLKNLLLTALAFTFTVSIAHSQDAILKPFVLASKGAGIVADKVTATKAALQASGFDVIGTYSPYADTTIIVVTNEEMKNTAAKSEHGGFGAAQRVSVVKVKDDVQVAYTNPVYMAGGYRLSGDLGSTAAKLQLALGKLEEFGATGMTATKLRKYHYMIGMEYFDEPSLLAEHASHEDALKAVEANLAAGKGGVSKVYRVDIPGKKESVFGVAMKANDKYFGDQFVMGVIDFKDVKSAAHLPYEILVTGNKVIALYARFRIALDFPDLKMVGDNSFLKIMAAPESIRKTLVMAAGGTEP